MSPRAKKIGVIILLAGALAVALIFFFFDPARTRIFPVCQFNRFTGLACPGCGSQRALHALAHGNFLAALHLNAVMVLSLPLFAWYAFRYAMRQWNNQPAPTVRARWLWVYLAVWIVFGVVRNLPVPLFAALR